ncbi:hypothetical protein Tco_0397922 [Tanacetum coccineum]
MQIYPDYVLNRLEKKQTRLRLYTIYLEEFYIESVETSSQASSDSIRIFMTLPDFKERWTEEMSYIHDVLEVMQISAFMSNSNCPELARRFSYQVPMTVTIMMRRVDDFIKSKEAYKSTELPRRSSLSEDKEHHTMEAGHPAGEQPSQSGCPNQTAKGNIGNETPALAPTVPFDAALEFGKLTHLVKDVRQRGNARGRQQGNNNSKGKVINMVWGNGDNQKHKSRADKEEGWMNALINFPLMLSDDVSDEPLIIKSEVKGYLVQRVFFDQGADVQVMFEHCFDNLPSSIKARLTPTQTKLVGFSGEQLIPIGKAELEVAFGSKGLCRRTMMKFTVFPTPRGIATLVGQTNFMFKCRRLEKKQTDQKGEAEEEKPKSQEEPVEEEILVNPAFPKQRVTIGTQFSKECLLQLINLLKK